MRLEPWGEDGLNVDAYWAARRVLRSAPRLARAIGAVLGGAKLAPAPAAGDAGKPSSRPPVSVVALSDADDLFAILATWAGRYGLPVALRARYGGDGEVVGYRSGAGSGGYVAAVEEAADFLSEVTDPAELMGSTGERVVETWAQVSRLSKIAASYPVEEREKFLTTPCTCGARIVQFPPEWGIDDPFIVCTGCGRIYDTSTLAAATELAVAVAKKHIGKGRPRVRLR